MREKWSKNTEPSRINDGQPVPQRLVMLPEQMYKPKLLLKSPSMRALKNYNNLSIMGTDNSPNTYDNLSFIPENENIDINSYDEPYTASITSDLSDHKHYDLYDYTTIGSLSMKTATSTGSELDSEKNEMGSTAKLVTKTGPCQIWLSHLSTVLCTISLAAGFGNLYRLPQTTLIRGGLPFLVAYVILNVLIGFPLLFLELGIGQLAQEGFIRSWRAVPFFKGVGYVKLIAGCLLSIYYPLYMGLALYYIIWLGKGPIPFRECAFVTRKETGYSADGINGQQCLRKTFLESPFEDPYWYGIYAIILFGIWVVVTILSIRRTKSFIRSLSILLFPTLACMIALTVKSVFAEDESESLEKFADDVDWSQLYNANVWYYAAVQVFFSTNVGFGSFVTNAGIIYNKVNPLWTAFGYMSVNVLLGVGSVIICNILAGNLDIKGQKGDVAELHLISIIYTVVVKSDRKDAKIWGFVAFATILLTGFISMATITYTLLKAITVQNKRRLKWWQTSIVLSFIGFISGCALLLKNFDLVHLLDHYIVGNLILISVIIEVFALIAFYGIERIKSDFEFMLGHILSNIWLILWWIMPLILTCIFAWALITLPLEGIFIEDPEWLYGTGWAVVLTATIFIFVVGFYNVMRQEDGYSLIDKFKASLKPSHNWGPKDPMLRHTWVQWNSKSQQGERDFTLKRKGTKDYTRSIKRSAKKAHLANGSDLTPSTLPRQSNDQNQNSINKTASYTEPYYEAQVQPQYEYNPLRVTSLVDTMGPGPGPTYINIRSSYDDPGYKTNINPLSRQREFVEFPDGSSEGYGTFRKGPYIIGDEMSHVCHRKYSQSEDATEL